MLIFDLVVVSDKLRDTPLHMNASQGIKVEIFFSQMFRASTANFAGKESLCDFCLGGKKATTPRLLVIHMNPALGKPVG